MLLAEDNPVNQKFAVQLLERKATRSSWPENGVEAIRAFKEESFDLVLMDVQMPEVGGLEATRQIRKWESNASVDPTPIVALTARATEKDREQCLEAGMDDYLSKPVRGEKLAELLEQLIPASPAEEESSQ